MTKTTILVEPGKLEITMTRIFAAPRALVFKAYTDPASIPLWWGPRRLTTTIDKMEVKKGGLWRFVQHDADGNEFAFYGVYHAVTPPERLVQTFEFEGTPGHVLLETMTFEDQGGKTLLKGQSVFQSVEARDSMVSSGMEGGAIETWDRLAELLARAAAH